MNNEGIICYACHAEGHVFTECTNEEAKINFKKQIKKRKLNLDELYAVYNSQTGTYKAGQNCTNGNPVLLPYATYVPYIPYVPCFQPQSLPAYSYYPNEQDDLNLFSGGQENHHNKRKRKRLRVRQRRKLIEKDLKKNKSIESKPNESFGFDINSLNRKIKRKRITSTITSDDMEISSSDNNSSDNNSSDNNSCSSTSEQEFKEEELKIKFNNNELIINQNNSFLATNKNKENEFSLIDFKKLSFHQIQRKFAEVDKLNEELNDNNEKIDYKETITKTDLIISVSHVNSNINELFLSGDQDYRNIFGVEQKNDFNKQNNDNKEIDVGKKSTDNKEIDVGKKSTDNQQVDVDKKSTDGKVDVGKKSTDGKVDVGKKSTDGKVDVGKKSTDGKVDVGKKSNDGKLDVGKKSTDGKKSNDGKVDVCKKSTDNKKPMDHNNQQVVVNKEINNNENKYLNDENRKKIEIKQSENNKQKIDEKQINNEQVKIEVCELCLMNTDGNLIVDDENRFYSVIISPIKPAFENECIIRSKAHGLSSFLSSSSAGFLLFKNIKFKMEIDFEPRKKKLIFFEYYAKHQNKKHFEICCLPINEDKFERIKIKIKIMLIKYKGQEGVDTNSKFFDNDLDLDNLKKEIGEQSYFLVLYGEASGFIYKFRNESSETRFDEDWLKINIYHYVNFLHKDLEAKIKELKLKKVQESAEKESRCKELIKIFGAKKLR